ncbi:MAG: rane protein of unknown function [Chloroflexi bacterium]|nr:rane protein of unknown function [Chloroflexota bacterium]
MVWTVYRRVHPSRALSSFGFTPEMADLQYREVTLNSRDGLRLNGWFIPRPGKASVILAHGLGSSASSLIFHAGFLARAGYSVLLINLRAHGKSQGRISTFGVNEANDILGALDYLRARPSLDPRQVGALGVSLGAQAVLRAAVQSDKLYCIVLEGLGASNLEDHGGPPTSLHHWITYPINWLTYWIGDFMSGVRSPESTCTMLRRLHCPVLLIASGGSNDSAFNRRFYEAANEPKSSWELPQAQHGGGLFFDREVYQKHVLEFFDVHLRGNGART